MRWLLAIGGLVLLGVLLAASLRAGPPSAADQQAIATHLETAVPLVIESGIGMWIDDRECRALSLDLDPGYADPPRGACAMGRQPFTIEARALFDRIAAAVAGAVPGGRVRIVSVAGDYTDVANGAGAVRRSVTFEVSPQVLGSLDSPLDLWQWTWSADPRPGEAGNLSEHWSFLARARNDG
jgi:hypothetical protein